MGLQKPATLGEFIIERQKDFQYSTGELTRLLSAIKLAAKVVNRAVNKAGLVDIIGAMGGENIHGEVQQKLDVFAHEKFIQALSNRNVVCGIASEERADFLAVEGGENARQRKYVVLIDPLDGSSNIDVNASIGTIFSIYRRVSPLGMRVTARDFLQRGDRQIAAGYVLYGAATLLIYSTGNGVNGFTLDPSLGTFYLSHPDIRIPETGRIYSVNEGYYAHFPEGVRDYIRYCQGKGEGRPYSARYIGSLVSDFHRNMLRGGIYLYPNTEQARRGKLRLLYECNPMAFIAEQAGGRASDGARRILEIEPTELHQRTPFFCGSADMVRRAESYLPKR